MSLDRLAPLDRHHAFDPTLDDDRDPHPQIATSATPRELDFDGAAHAAVHLPHGLIPSRPTIGVVMKDLGDFEGKLRRLQTDLGSPAMRVWFAKHGAATKTGVSIGVRAAAIVLTILILKEKGVALLATAEGVLKLVTGAEKIAGLVGDCNTFAHQLVDEQRAMKDARPDIVRVEHDLFDVMSAGAKLASDMKRLAGT